MHFEMGFARESRRSRGRWESRFLAHRTQSPNIRIDNNLRLSMTVCEPRRD